ncbi:nuclear transport factor 2 family protein [Caenimonas soli]|uniref:methanesulfonate monooxygenase n=1 Tax=Caenimonas soli TaxID=2735555 RepID=UPI001556914F|nr:methanesulfonate monooxygenase [Caenimonas soli]NPC59132.1 methanesulfonate monooxygenase [Caenimonas soli]
MDANAMLRQQIARDLVCETSLHLNAGDWAKFLELCDDGSFEYSIINYSPEIRKTQCWMKQDRAGLAKVLNLLPKHNSDRAQLTRHIMPSRVTPGDEEGSFEVVSQMTVYRTEWDAENSHLQSGATSLYVVGKYIDHVILSDSGARLCKRIVELDTRQVGIGSHHIL